MLCFSLFAEAGRRATCWGLDECGGSKGAKGGKGGKGGKGAAAGGGGGSLEDDIEQLVRELNLTTVRRGDRGGGGGGWTPTHA